MPWVRFTTPFVFKPKPNVAVAYKAGSEYLVKQDCAAAAIAAGKAVKITRRRKEAIADANG